MKKIFLPSLVVLTGVVTGAVGGGYMTFHRYARDYAIVRAFTWLGISDSVSVNQYNQNSKDAKMELAITLAFYEQGIKSSAIEPALKQVLRMNRGLIGARLSVLENEAGNADQAKSYLSQSQEDLKAVGWIDRSEATILHAVRRQPVSPCGSTGQSVAKARAPAIQKPCS